MIIQECHSLNTKYRCTGIVNVNLTDTNTNESNYKYKHKKIEIQVHCMIILPYIVFYVACWTLASLRLFSPALPQPEAPECTVANHNLSVSSSLSITNTDFSTNTNTNLSTNTNSVSSQPRQGQCHFRAQGWIGEPV